ncbi:MAG: NUDIX domain-containing protein [Bacteroidetes bacterium]|nr:MAG: NUDIX domain-containing protein [Bacteroidota bacterium]
MSKKSAGILLYRIKNKMLEVLLVHPGGPFWIKKDAGAWTIPKGELNVDEEPFDAAIREMKEETGIILKGNFIELTPVKQKGGKLVYAWAKEQDVDLSDIKSNEFEMEWPPKSGKKKIFPEIDKADWFDLKTAKEKMNAGQVPLIQELIIKLKSY